MKNVIRIYISTENNRTFSKKMLYKADRRRIRRSPNLIKNSSFSISRILRHKFKIKDNFSLSHKKDIAVIVKAKFKLGIDIEEIKERNFNAITDFCFSEFEKNLVINSDDKILSFYQIYTAKEAYLKFKNLSFSYLKDIDISKICDKIETIFLKFDNFLICIVMNKNRKNHVRS